MSKTNIELESNFNSLSNPLGESNSFSLVNAIHLLNGLDSHSGGKNHQRASNIVEKNSESGKLPLFYPFQHQIASGLASSTASLDNYSNDSNETKQAYQVPCGFPNVAFIDNIWSTDCSFAKLIRQSLPKINSSINSNLNATQETSQKIYSRKVFIGGLPNYICHREIQKIFAVFGALKVEWPYKKLFQSNIPPRGYCFLIYQSDRSVMKLLEFCNFEAGSYFYQLQLSNQHSKKIQVRPWKIRDSIFIDLNDRMKLLQKYSQSEIDNLLYSNNSQIENILGYSLKSILFIGGIPRHTNALSLVKCLSEKFGQIKFVEICLDKEHDYPKGAAKILFVSRSSYIQAFCQRFEIIDFTDGSKRVELKPYIYDNHPCEICNDQYAGSSLYQDEVGLKQHKLGSSHTNFCGSLDCLRYYCQQCWKKIHSQILHSNDSRAFFDHRRIVKDHLENDSPQKSKIDDLNSIFIRVDDLRAPYF